MAVDLESRARALLGRLGSVPGDPHRAREFLQRRVRIYLGVTFAIWLVVFLLDLVLVFVFRQHQSFHIVAHTITTIVVGGLWLLARRGAPTVRALRALEVGVTLGQVVVFVAICAQYPAQWRPNMTMIVGAAHILALRASIVPGAPRSALVLGAMTHLPVIVATWFVHARDVRPVGMPPFGLEIVATVMWSTISTVVSATIAWVIYGLQEKVRVAMELGQYTLLEKIGEGAMGTVYRARHALLRRPTAVKVLGRENAGEQTIARFSREVQLTSEISHPNVVSVYDFGRSPDGEFYYAMELLDGIDLQKLVEQDGPQPPARVAFLLAQIAEGLAEAHSVGLIHRDVKPGNVVVCDHPRRPDHVKVVDFGLVKQVGNADPSLSAENIVAGTPLYMAPEAITSPQSIDARSDLYAVGAVGYFLLTGEPVFAGRTVFEVVGQTLHQSVTPPSERAPGPVPSKLERLLLECLAKAKEDRPASASALLERLRACDDVAGWGREEARTWWQSRGARVRDASASQPQLTARRSSEITRTLIVAPREVVSDESA